MTSNFPFYKQPDAKDCGPTCLRIIAKYYGKLISLQEIREFSETTRSGSNLLKLSEAAEAIGFKTIGARLDYNRLKQAQLPLIAHWDKKHFVVVYRIKKEQVYLSDPAYGLIRLSKAEFIARWIGNNADESTKEGVTLLLEVTPDFKRMKWEEENKRSLRFLFRYLFNYKNLLVQLGIGLLVGSLLQLIFPFLSQSIVDVGIQNQDISYLPGTDGTGDADYGAYQCGSVPELDFASPKYPDQYLHGNRLFYQADKPAHCLFRY